MKTAYKEHDLPPPRTPQTERGGLDMKTAYKEHDLPPLVPPKPKGGALT
jgi:hypothetical protein